MATINTPFIASADRIEMPYWAQGLLGTFGTDLVAEMCNGEKSCL